VVETNGPSNSFHSRILGRELAKIQGNPAFSRQADETVVARQHVALRLASSNFQACGFLVIARHQERKDEKKPTAFAVGFCFKRESGRNQTRAD
jgi:hypothetical protein